MFKIFENIRQKIASLANVEGIVKKSNLFLIYLILSLPLYVTSDLLVAYGQGKVFAFRIAVEVMCAFWLFLLFASKKFREKAMQIIDSNKLLFAATGIFFLSATVSTIFGVDPFYSFWSDVQRMTGLLTLAHVAVFFLIISTTLSRKDWLNLIKYSVFIALITCALALSEGNFIHLMSFSRLVGPLGNSEYLAAYLLFNLFFCLIAAWSASSKIEKYIFGFALVPITTVILLSGTRAAFVGLLAGAIAYLCLFVNDLVANKQTKLFCYKYRYLLAVTTLLIVLSSSVVIWSYNHQDNDFVQKTPLNYISKINLAEGNRRFLVWDISLQAIAERPFIGWGPENFQVAYEKYYNPKLYEGEGASSMEYDRAHNIIFDITVEQGVLGLASYLAIFVVALYYLYMRRVKSKTDLLMYFIVTPLLVSYFVQNLFQFDTIMTYIFMYFIISFITLADDNRNSSQQPKIKIRKLLLGTILLLVITAIPLWFFNISPMIGSLLEVDSIHLFQKGESSSAISDLKQSLSYGPTLGVDSDNFFLEELSRRFAKKDKESTTVELMKTEVVKLESNHNNRISTLASLGQLYGRSVYIDNANLDKAILKLNQAIRLSPKQLFLRYNLARVYLDNGNDQGALKALAPLTDFEPKENVDTNWLKLEVALSTNNIPELLSNLDEINQKTITTNKTTIDDPAILNNYLRVTRLGITLDKVSLLENSLYPQIKAYALDNKLSENQYFSLLMIEIDLNDKLDAQDTAQTMSRLYPGSNTNLMKALQ